MVIWALAKTVSQFTLKVRKDFFNICQNASWQFRIHKLQFLGLCEKELHKKWSKIRLEVVKKLVSNDRILESNLFRIPLGNILGRPLFSNISRFCTLIARYLQIFGNQRAIFAEICFILFLLLKSLDTFKCPQRISSFNDIFSPNYQQPP